LKKTPRPDIVAAIDLGSNSFHMIVARLEDTGTLSIIDRLRDSVRLGGGLTKRNRLKGSAQKRAFACLESFAQRVRDLPDSAVRIAGTNTLRIASNSHEFVRRAEKILQHPIEIIAGREEARLIYLGVAHGLAAREGKRLVVDIGGGSTECIIGTGMNPLRRESLYTGCVSTTIKYFGDGVISKTAMSAAQTNASLTILPQVTKFSVANWDNAIGCAGTIRAVRSILHEEGMCNNGIEYEALIALRKKVIKAGHINKLELAGLSDSHRPVIVGGLAVLLGVFDTLGIEHMQVSNQSMREGLLYDLVGRINHQDVRDATIEAMLKRWGVDKKQSTRVAHTAAQLYEQVADYWNIDDEQFARLLTWAAQLHEIGLQVSHYRYHQHGSYLLSNADMQGFSRQEQALLAMLTLNHRSKFHINEFSQLMKTFIKPARRLCLLLRLAVLIHRDHAESSPPPVSLQVNKKHLHIKFPENWLQTHSLTLADLHKEVGYLEKAGYSLTFE